MKSLQYPYSTPLYVSVLHGVFCLPLSSLSLSAALADQHTSAASLDRALSHTAVFFFHVRPCCLPLWCQILFFVRANTFTLHLQNCPDGWQGACMCSHAICSLSAWTPSLPNLNGAGACYWPSGDWVIQDTHTHTQEYTWTARCLGLATTTVRTRLFLSVYSKSILRHLKQRISVLSVIHTGLVLPGDLVWFKIWHPHLLPAVHLHGINSVSFSYISNSNPKDYLRIRLKCNGSPCWAATWASWICTHKTPCLTGLALPGLHVWFVKNAKVICVLNPIQVLHFDRLSVAVLRSRPYTRPTQSQSSSFCRFETDNDSYGKLKLHVRYSSHACAVHSLYQPYWKPIHHYIFWQHCHPGAHALMSRCVSLLSRSTI